MNVIPHIEETTATDVTTTETAIDAALGHVQETESVIEKIGTGQETDRKTLQNLQLQLRIQPPLQQKTTRPRLAVRSLRLGKSSNEKAVRLWMKPRLRPCVWLEKLPLVCSPFLYHTCSLIYNT
jgi:hypothetical protein